MPIDVANELQEVFRQVLNRPALVLRPELTADDVEGWDSLKHIELVVSAEERFGVRFKTAEVRGLSNVGDMIRKIEEKLGT